MNRKLARELRTAGVPKDEIAELTRAAERLSSLHVPGMSAASRQRVASRLPVDVELADSPRHMTRVRWAMAGSFAALVLVAGAVWLLPGTQQSSNHQGDQAHKVTKPETPEQQLEQQAQQLEQLQKQPVVDQKQVQKTKSDFKQTYDKYQQTHKDERDFKNHWNDYQSQWWWKGSSSSQTKSSESSSQSQSSDSNSDDSSSSRSRSRSSGN